jgi:hypothetical protein
VLFKAETSPVGELQHIYDVAYDFNLKTAATRPHIDRLNQATQDLGGFRPGIIRIERLVQSLDLAPV